MSLPEDIASALTDGVILCHLANYVRPRSVASIHVPTPGVVSQEVLGKILIFIKKSLQTKLTMARCRRNVDNFLEACRRIGVDEVSFLFVSFILTKSCCTKTSFY